MPTAALEIRAISGHSGASPGKGAKRSDGNGVSKLIDVTTCIGCKACEVACVEWNGYPFRETTFHNTYQTMPDLEWNYYNLIRFNEHEFADGSFGWLMRKDQCMHCADPGCLRACPADGAIVQYANGIVDFQQEHCIGCEYCVTGCPFNIPKFNAQTRKVHKCTLCSDRVAVGLEPACIKSCPTGCLHFGSKDDMRELAETRAAQFREHTSHKNAGVYDPAGVGGTQVIYVLHDIRNPEAYGGLPANPRIPILVSLWKGPMKWLGGLAVTFGLVGVAGHFLRYGPKEDHDASQDGVAKDKEPILRYTLRERVNHWLASFSYLYLLATGLALFSPHLFWLAAVLGGGPTIRFWHPWAGLVFSAAVFWMHRMWRGEMRTTAADREWSRKVKLYIENRDREMPPVDRFNPGQKQFYWVMLGGMIVLLISGIVMWFPEYVPWLAVRSFAIILHEAGALITIGAFIVHVYMGLFVVPCGFRAIVHGYVSRAWAKAHHRLWYNRITGEE